MTVRLSHWQSADGRYERIYVNGLDADAKVWLERARGDAVRLRASGGAAFDEAAVLAEIAALLPGAALTWSAALALALATPRRGRRPGTTAAARAGLSQASDRLPGLQPTRWTAEDANFLDPDAMAHPLPAPVRLMVDNREPAEMVDRLRAARNLEVEITELETGDYLVDPYLVIERKTVADFITSITEDAKRLFRQTDRLARFEAPPILLIEGDLYGQSRITLEQISGTLSYLSVLQRVSILPTLSLAHSAYMIVKCIRHALFGLGYDLGLRGAGPKDPGPASAFVLEGIPGVSARRARALLRHFGTLQAVALADPADLQKVEGIGPATARTIAAVFRTASD